MKTPVVFICFNRPKLARRVFSRVREARPEKLYIIADGPRPYKPGEPEKCTETRRLVESMIDWPCEVRKNYAETNMGCGRRIISGLDWVFNRDESAVIIEDDVLTDPSFFPFCETLLARYRDAAGIMQIGGYNRFNYDPGNSSYFYSRYAGIWGWATWRRAWQRLGEMDEAEWARIKRENLFRDKCLSETEAALRSQALNDVFSGRIDTWASRWDLTKTMNNGLGIIPSRNLVKNIGYSLTSTHTINPFDCNRFVRIHNLAPPYIAPPAIEADSGFDRRYNATQFSPYVKFRTKVWKLVHHRR